MLKKFSFVLEVEAPVCDDSPGFPEHAYALDWLVSQLMAARSDKLMSAIQIMSRGEIGISAADKQSVETYDRDAERLLKVAGTIKPLTSS